MPFEDFGPFELERLLGRGGMAEVFVAHRRGQPDRLVLKRIRPDLAASAGSEYLKRFVLEAQVASRLSHPNLVRFREFGKVGDCHYIAMDEVRGHSLHRLIDHVFETGQRPPIEVALHIVAGMLDGLATMHGVVDEEGRARPMVHRDVTPKNVILAADGKPVVIDFGIAKDVLGPAITLPGKVIGTARYMAPEHRKAEYIDARADVFSVSVIFFEILVGRPPWKPLETLKELLRFTFDPPELPAELALPKDVAKVLLRGLACEPGDRFESAQDMAKALKQCAAWTALGDRGPRLTREWVSSLHLPSDQELREPVLDHGPKDGALAELAWTATGGLSSGDVAFDSVPPDPHQVDASILTIPPLPPPRAAVLGTAELSLDLEPPKSRPMWLVVLVICVVMFGLGVGAVFLLSGSL